MRQMKVSGADKVKEEISNLEKQLDKSEKDL